MKLSLEQKFGLALFDGGAAAWQTATVGGMKRDLLEDATVRRVFDAAASMSGDWGGEQLLNALTGADAALVKGWSASKSWENRPGIDAVVRELRERPAKAPSAVQEALSPADGTVEPSEVEDAPSAIPPPPPPRAVPVDITVDVLDALLARAEPLEDVPMPLGILGVTADWILRRSIKPYRPTAVAAALEVWSVVLGRKVTFRKLGPNLYFLVALDSSFGKNDFQGLFSSILRQVGVSSAHVSGEPKSASAGMERLNGIWYHPVHHYGRDEFGQLFADREDRYGAVSFIRGLWSSGEGLFDSDCRTSGQGKANLRPVWRPSGTALLVTQPDTLAKNAHRALITNGTYPRCLWILPGNIKPKSVLSNRDRDDWMDNPAADDAEDGLRVGRALRLAWEWLDEDSAKRFRNMTEAEAELGKPPKPGPKKDADEGDQKRRGVWTRGIRLEADADVKAVFEVLKEWEDRRVADDREFGGIYNKFTEKVTRLAILLAGARCAEGFTMDESGRVVPRGDFKLDKNEVLWAARWVLAADNAAYAWACENVYDSYLQSQVNQVIRILKEHGGEMVWRTFNKATLRVWNRTDQKEKVLRYMAHEIECIEIVEVGKTTMYRLKR